MQPPKPSMVCAHGGDTSGGAPTSTLAAFQAAADAGLPCIEASSSDGSHTCPSQRLEHICCQRFSLDGLCYRSPHRWMRRRQPTGNSLCFTCGSCASCCPASRQPRCEVCGWRENERGGATAAL